MNTRRAPMIHGGPSRGGHPFQSRLATSTPHAISVSTAPSTAGHSCGAAARTSVFRGPIATPVTRRALYVSGERGYNPGALANLIDQNDNGQTRVANLQSEAVVSS